MKHAEDRSAGAGLRIARNAVTLTVGRVGADALGLLLFVAISRSLGPAGTGAYSYAFAVATLIFFLTSLGVDTYGVREYLRLPEGRRGAFLAELLGTQLSIIATALLGLSVYLVIVGANAGTVAIIASLTFFQVANSIAQTLFVPAMAGQRFNQSATALFIGRFVAFVPTAVCVQFANLPLTRAVLAFPLAGIVLLALAIHRAVQDGAPLRPAISRVSVTRVGLSLWTFASAELVAQAFPRIGLIVASSYLGDASAGLYATGMKLLELACVPVSFLGVAAFPRLSRLHDARPQAFHELAVQLLWVLVLTSGAVGWFMYFLAPYVVVPLLGKAFAGSEHVLKMMALVGVVQAAETVMWPLLLASGQQVARLKFATVALACNIVLSIALAPLLGLDGVIWAGAASYLFMGVLFFGVLRRALPSGPLLCVMAGLIAATAGASLVAVFAELAKWPIVLEAAVIAVVFASIVALFYFVSRHLIKVDGQVLKTVSRPTAPRSLPHQPAKLRYALLYESGPWPEWRKQALAELIEAAGDPIVNVVCGSDPQNGNPSPLLVADATVILENGNATAVADHLRNDNLDFIVCFATLGVGRMFSMLPRYGVWAFHIGDWINYRGNKPGFWEVYAREPVSTAMLVRVLSDENAVIPLKQATLRTKRHSYHTNVRQLEARCIHWLAQVAREIQAGATSRFVDSPIVSTTPWRNEPSALQLACYAMRVVQWIAGESFRTTFVSEQWNVGIIDRPIQMLLNADALPPVRWLPKLRAREFIADPFGVLRDGKLTILCEHFDYATGLGQLIAIDAEHPERRGLMKIGPQPPVHLSYPHVMEVDGELLCTPESVKAREVALYRCERFPDVWSRVATLIANVELVDVTICRYESRWWLAGSDPGPAGASSELHLWYADELTGPWRPHLSNPVKIDARSARPGGTVFWSDDSLYRPAQDCSTYYGRRIVINRITKLSPTEYAEQFVNTVEPSAQGLYRAGLHTVSAVGNMTLIDSKRWVFAKEELPRAIGRILTTIFGKRKQSYDTGIVRELTVDGQ
jgi:O-antigen/teichoic acid export membrane protein